MVVHFDRVVIIQMQSVLAHNLTYLRCMVLRGTNFALVRKVIVVIEYFQLINVVRGELAAVHIVPYLLE